jgi:hypothetical protein
VFITLTRVHYLNAVKTRPDLWQFPFNGVILPSMAKIAADTAAQMVQKLPGWKLDRDSIQRQFTFPGFPEAVAFVVRLAFTA